MGLVRDLPSWKVLPNGCSALLIALLAVNFFSPFSDLDFAWQIRTGELVLRTGQLRPPEAFTYTIAGRLIPDFEWLYDIGLYFLWSALGFPGVKLLQVVLVTTPLLLLAVHLHREGVRWRGVALSVTLVIIAAAPAWNVRPYYCTTIGVLLLTILLHDHCHGRRPVPAWLPLFMLLWANLHPAVIVGQAILLGAIAWEWVNRWVQLNPPLDRAACARLALIGGLGIAASFIAPDPIERLLYPFHPWLRHPIMRMFHEIQPLSHNVGRLPLSVAVLGLVAALTLWTVVRRFRHYRLWEVAVLAGEAWLAVTAMRALQDALLVMLALAVPQLAALMSQAARTERGRPAVAGLLRVDRFAKRMTNDRLFRFEWFWPAVAFLLLVLAVLLPPVARRLPIPEPWYWPTGAVNAIAEQGLKGRFFGPADYGAYLILFAPDRAKVYVDTRGFFFPPELLEDSVFILKCEFDWRQRLPRVLDEYRTDYFLLPAAGEWGVFWQTLQPHIARPLYADDRAVLLSAAQVRAAVGRLPADPVAP